MRRPALLPTLRKLRLVHLLAILGFAALSACAGSKDSAYGSDLATHGPALEGQVGPGGPAPDMVGPGGPPPAKVGPTAPTHALEEAEAPAEYRNADAGGADYAARAPARQRPGLGTAYGEQRHSSVRSVDFVRKQRNRPDAVLSMHYDDWSGVEAAARHFGWQHPQWSSASTSVWGLNVSLLDEQGNTLSGGRVGDRHYAVGQPGSRYVLAIHNGSDQRFEVVASVDGLDVIDGESASYRKRGYVIEPWSSLQIDGWRTSDDSVAAFRFSSVEDSYAGRKGKARNVGVIGFAFFAEQAQRYAEPPPPPRYDRRRDYANPFPGR